MKNFKTLEKASKIYAEIKHLDSEIIEIESMANQILNDNCILSFDLNIENISEAKRKEAESKALLDEDGSLNNAPIFHYASWGSPAVQSSSETRKYQFEGKECLQVLEHIAKAKMNTRNNLVLKLRSMGIK